MQNVITQTRPFPSWAAVLAGLLAIIAATFVVLYLNAQAGTQSATRSLTPVVTPSVGSELVRHNTSERNAVSEPPSNPGSLHQSGPR
jgi:hypothetical protein